MRSLKTLIDLLRKPLVAARDLETAAHEADQIAQAAEIACVAAEEAYQAGLLGDERTLAKLDNARRAAVVERDRTRRLADELDTRLTAAVSEERRARRQAAHNETMAQAEAIRARFAKEYNLHAGAIRSLLAALAEAEVARSDTAQDAAEFGDIPPVEDAIRRMSWSGEEIVEIKTVHLWVIDGRTDPIPADQIENVRPRSGTTAGSDKGMLPYQGGLNAGFWDVTRRPFRLTRYREQLDFDAPSLLQVVNLPALHPYGDAFVTAERWRSPDTSLAHLRQARRPDPVIERPVRERLELVPPEPATHEPIVPFAKREPDPVRDTRSAREIREAHSHRAMAAEADQRNFEAGYHAAG